MTDNHRGEEEQLGPWAFLNKTKLTDWASRSVFFIAWPLQPGSSSIGQLLPNFSLALLGLALGPVEQEELAPSPLLFLSQKPNLSGPVFPELG